MNFDPDKWQISRQKLFQANFLAAHVFFIGWCVYAFDWVGVVIGLLFYMLFGKIGGDVGFHRYFSHQSFVTSKFKERVMLVLGTLAGFGSSISWVAMHSVHHAKVDTQDDPHSPHRVGFWRTYFYLYDYNFSMTKADTRYLRQAVRDKWQLYIHRNYFKLYYAFISLVAMSAYALDSMLPLVGLWALPVVCIFHGSGAVNAVCHKYGYQRYPDAGHSTNNFWLNVILLGNASHNNHHAKPWAYHFNTADVWYEFDLWGWMIEKFFKDK